MSVTAEQIKQLEEYDAATVQNAAIRVRGYVDAGGDYTDSSLIRRIETQPCVVGIAATSTWTSIEERDDGIPRTDFYAAIETEPLPVIAVMRDVDATRMRGAIIGDVMATMMTAVGVRGAVVDGNSRDIPGIEATGLNLWSRGRVPGHGAFNMIEFGTKIEICGLTVAQGDVLVCDTDGVTRVPVDIVGDVIKACTEVRAKEGQELALAAAPGFTIDKLREHRGLKT
jgi:regulator of RNase E activity RraA